MFQSITSASVFFSEWRMHDMIDDLSRLSPIQKPSLNSRAAIVCGMSPIDLSSIFSWSIKRPAGEKIVCSQTFSVYKPSHSWLENAYHSLNSSMLFFSRNKYSYILVQSKLVWTNWIKLKGRLTQIKKKPKHIFSLTPVVSIRADNFGFICWGFEIYVS